MDIITIMGYNNGCVDDDDVDDDGDHQHLSVEELKDVNRMWERVGDMVAGMSHWEGNLKLILVLLARLEDMRLYECVLNISHVQMGMDSDCPSADRVIGQFNWNLENKS